MIKESLFAQSEREAKLDKRGDILQSLNAEIDFRSLSELVDKVAPRPNTDKGGRPAFPTELMIRVLVLGQLYNLSDEALEYQLLDRMSFQRFVGLKLSSQIPDGRTIWHFKERLNKAGAMQVLFEGFHRQLSIKGFTARGGQIVDASLVSSPVQHFTSKEKEGLEEGKIPEEWSEGKRRQKDLDASWTKKHGKSYHGYKVTVNVDKRCKLIRGVRVDTAKTHDTHAFESVLNQENSSMDIYADKGYIDGEREKRLMEQGHRMHIQRKTPRGKKQSDCQKKRNRAIASPRAKVEHVFASFRQMGGNCLRSIGYLRAEGNLFLKAAVYNMRRLVSIRKIGLKPF